MTSRVRRRLILPASVLMLLATLLASCGGSSPKSGTGQSVSTAQLLGATTTVSSPAKAPAIPPQVQGLPAPARARIINLIHAGWKYGAPEASSDLQGFCSETGIVMPGSWGIDNAKASESLELFLLTSTKPIASHVLNLLKVNSTDEVQQAGSVIYIASSNAEPNINNPTAGPPKPPIPVARIVATAEQGAPGLEPSTAKAPCAKYNPPTS